MRIKRKTFIVAVVMIEVFFDSGGIKMFGFIITILVISSLLGDVSGTRRLLKDIFTFMAVMYGLRLILLTGFHLIPFIIVVWALSNVVVPFIRGFMDSFDRSGGSRGGSRD